MENWRYFFYYLLGLLPPLFFGLRFLIQWIKSEKKKRSYVDKTFWHLSFCGNAILALHYFVQMQYLLFLIQVANGFIAWRNLNLFNIRKLHFRAAVIVLLTVLILSTAFFFIQATLLSLPINFLELPLSLSKETTSVSIFWHLVGAFGCLLFASRFWIQWLKTEKLGESKLGRSFWLISIFGSGIALVYFIKIGDWVSALNYSFGFIPYIRNLVLIRQNLSKNTS